MNGFKWIKSDYFKMKNDKITGEISQKRPLFVEKHLKMCKFDKKEKMWITMWKLWFSHQNEPNLIVDRLGYIKKLSIPTKFSCENRE